MIPCQPSLLCADLCMLVRRQIFDRGGSLWKKQPLQLSSLAQPAHCFDLWPAEDFTISECEIGETAPCDEWIRLPRSLLAIKPAVIISLDHPVLLNSQGLTDLIYGQLLRTVS